MAALTHDTSASKRGIPVLGDGDPFDNPGVWVVVVLIVVVTLATAAGLGAVYYGDEVAQPSWNTHSVPAPRVVGTR